MKIWRRNNPDSAPSAQDDWLRVNVEAPGELILYGGRGRAHLAVSLSNASCRELTPTAGRPLVFSYKLLDASGELLPAEGIRTPLSGSVAPGTTHTQKIAVSIPPELLTDVSAIRVGLLEEGAYWVEQFNPSHPQLVQLVPAPALSPFDTKLAIADQIWDQGKGNGLRWPYGAMMVAQHQKLFYIPVAKCACTSLKSMMVQLAEVEKAEIAIELGVHFVTDRFNTGVQLKDLPIDRAREILASGDYFKFGVIRDPFERLVSAYLEKFVYKRRNQRNLLHTRPVISAVQGSAEIDIEQGISFDAFVGYILSQDPFELDAHWRPQHLYFLGVRHLSRVFRLEEIGQLETYLQRHHGVEIELGHENRTRKSDVVLPEASTLAAAAFDKLDAIDPASFFATRHADAIRNYYREDFEFYDSAG